MTHGIPKRLNVFVSEERRRERREREAKGFLRVVKMEEERVSEEESQRFMLVPVTHSLIKFRSILYFVCFVLFKSKERERKSQKNLRVHTLPSFTSPSKRGVG